MMRVHVDFAWTVLELLKAEVPLQSVAQLDCIVLCSAVEGKLTR